MSRILNQSRFIDFALDMLAEQEELASPKSLELVVGAQWQVHRVSPMWGVPYLAGGAGQEREEGVGTCRPDFGGRWWGGTARCRSCPCPGSGATGSTGRLLSSARILLLHSLCLHVSLRDSGYSSHDSS